MTDYDNGGMIGGLVSVTNTSGEPIRIHPYLCECLDCWGGHHALAKIRHIVKEVDLIASTTSDA